MTQEQAPGPAHDPHFVAGERAQLEQMLDTYRDEAAATLEGLTDEQARRRLVPSLTTPLGLLTHLTFVEQVWWHVALAGRTRAELGLSEEVDPSFQPPDDATVESVLADYRRVCAEAREIASAYSLDDLVLHNRRSPLTVRYVYLHLVQEIARHTGHGDILREQVLGSEA